MHGLTMGEWYCGAGIGAVGFLQAGYDIKYAFDFNKYAVKTYNANHGDHAYVQDATKLDPSTLPDVDVITGGFPCQPFSVGGTNLGEKDERKGNLGFHFFEGIRIKQPKAFLAENVEGLTSAAHIGFLYRLLEHITKSGYNVVFIVIDCWEYGVAQSRFRVFIAGIRKDLGLVYSFPSPIPVEERKTLRDAIGDLPPPSPDCGIPNHDRYHDGGWSSRQLSGNRQRQWHEPSFTIVSSARHLPMYPEPPNYDWRKMTDEQRKNNPIPRRFTVRECLRIQSVPDWFYFPDDDSYSPDSLLTKQYERCSGIPPLIAYKLSKRLADILTGKYTQASQKKLF